MNESDREVDHDAQGSELLSCSLSPHEVVIPSERIWSEFTESEKEVFEESIKSKGIELPVKCLLIDNRYYVVDGGNRVEAARQFGIEKIPVVYRRGTMDEVTEENMFLNFLRGKSDPVQMILILLQLYEKVEGDFDQLRKRTGYSDGYLRKLLKIATSHKDVLDALSRHEITIAAAIQLSRLESVEWQEIGVMYTKKYKMTEEQLRETVPVWNEEAKKPPAERRPIEETVVLDVLCPWCGDRYTKDEMHSTVLCIVCYAEMVKRKKQRPVMSSISGEARL